MCNDNIDESIRFIVCICEIFLLPLLSIVAMYLCRSLEYNT